MNTQAFKKSIQGKAVKANAAKRLKFVNPLNVGIPAFDHVTCSNEYGFYCVPSSFLGREVPRILRQGEVYEPKTLALMRRIVGDGDIISGGGFIGDFFPALAEVLAPGAALFSFEPNPVSYEAARRTIALNALKNVVFSQVAVGEHDDILPLQIACDNNSAMAARAKIVREGEAEGTIDVQVTTLDAMIPQDRNVTVLHLDIEGHEMPALLGAKNLINRCRPTIIVEAAKPKMRKFYARCLKQHFPDVNYGVCGNIERNIIFRPDAG